jgi:hypothetical protein
MPCNSYCLLNFIDEDISMYPFTKDTLKEILNAIGEYARDIKAICIECIEEMRRDASRFS